MRKTMFALALAVATLSAAVVPVSALGSPTGGEPPLADAGLDQRVTIGTTVTLDATGSRDPDGRLVSYRWRVETPDGRTTTPTPPNRGRTSLTVTEPGRYEVTVTVTDDDGNTASDTLYVVVDGTPAPTTRPSTPEPPTPRTTPDPPTSSTPATPDTTVSSTSTTAPTAPTGVADPPSADPPSAAPPGPPGPDCTDSFGPDCITPPDCTDLERLESGCIRFLRVEGPDTLAEGETGTYTAVAEGFDGEVSFRWQAGEVSRSVERTFSPGEHTVVVTATDGERTFIAEKTVYVDRNAPPKVSIEDPGALEPGASIVLSLGELRDPDGTVTSVSWSGGTAVRSVRGMKQVRSVTVPDGNGSKRVEVTAVDDDGESATDVLILNSSTGTDQTSQKIPTTRTAQCTYYEYGGKTTDQPIRCWNKATGELVYDRDPNEGPDAFVGPHSHPDWEVDWYRVSRPDDDTIRPGSAMAKDVAAPAKPVQEENTDRANNTAPRNQTLVTIVSGASSAPGFDPYNKDGKSVATDLTGDGKVDLQDWQERYGDPTAKSIQNDKEQVKALKTELGDQTASSSDSSGTSGGMAETVQNAFDDLTDSVNSVVSDDSSSSESSNEGSSQSSSDGIQDTVSDTVDAVTEAFENLGGSESDSESQDSDSSESAENTDSSNSGTDTGQSCSTTALGFEICL